MLPFVLYGCETWSVMLREEHRLRVLDKRVLREIFGGKTEELTWDWRKLHKQEPVLRLIWESPVFYVTRRFITLFTKAGHLQKPVI
jgi:hypothetical protein